MRLRGRLGAALRGRSSRSIRASGTPPTSPRSPPRPPRACSRTAALRDDVASRSLAAAEERGFAAVARTLEDVYAGLGKRRRVHQRAPLEDRAPILADLHMHTNHSHDCATDPEALLDHCIAQGLGAVAITDHNEVSGALEAAAARKAASR